MAMSARMPHVPVSIRGAWNGALYPANHALDTGDNYIRLLHTHLPGHTDEWRKHAVPGWPTIRDDPGCSLLRKLVGLCPTTPQPFRLVDGSLLYSETLQFCAPLFLSGLAVATPGSLVVEMGTLLGHSSRCMAQGLAAREPPLRNTSLYVAFDFFKLRPGLGKDHRLLHETMQKLKNKSYESAIWHDLLVHPVYRGPLQAIPGDIELNAPPFFERIPSIVPVAIWSIDSAKTHAHFIAQAADVWPHLRVGSVIHLVDNLKCQVHMMYSEFVRSGELEVAYVAFGASPWSFVVRKPLDFGRVCNAVPQTHSALQVIQAPLYYSLIAY